MARSKLLLAGCLALAALLAPPVSARELAVPAGDLLAAQVAGVHGIPEHGMAVVLLTVGAAGELPVFIGGVEAEAIERARRGLRPPRPLTHELLGDVLVATGWTVERVVIDELREGQFLAAIELRHEENGRRRMLDTRPSDALAVAVRQGAPVFVARQVLEAALEEESESPSARPRGVLTAAVHGAR